METSRRNIRTNCKVIAVGRSKPRNVCAHEPVTEVSYLRENGIDDQSACLESKDMWHDFSKVFAVWIGAAGLEEEVAEKNCDDHIAKYGEIVLSAVLDVAGVERRLH